jgi:hypothetical protein
LLINPTLSDLVGGVDSVTLSDEEARRRGTQKSVLERRAPPTFDVLVEILDRQTFAVHHDVAKAVDALLRQRALQPEIRHRNEAGEIQIERPAPTPTLAKDTGQPRDRNGDYGDFRGRMAASGVIEFESNHTFQPKKVYCYGVGQNRLRQATRTLQVPVTIVDDLDDADLLMTLKSYYRKHPQPIVEAERMGKPVYVLRSNTVIQMESCLADIFSLSERETESLSVAMRETQEAIRKILSGTRSIELAPQTSHVRREQHQLAREANLVSHSMGREPYRRVRIYRDTASGGR